nr:hypothetical protein [Candidatus Woesearchaeota archaeon]
MNDSINKRKENLIKFFKEKSYWIYIALAIILIFGFWVRTRNWWLLQGKWLVDPDAHLFLRYAKYILEHGSLFLNDPLRYYPVGYNTAGETTFLSYFIVYLYKFLHIFIPNLTLTQLDIAYPAIVFVPAMIFFFLLVRRLFNWKIALLSTGFLTVIPQFLFRTMSGVSDKEGLAILFFFMSFYFYVVAWQSVKTRNAVIFGLLAGFGTFLTGLSWGGVQFLFLIIPIFALIELFLNKLDKKNFYVYAAWALSTIILLVTFFPARFTINYFLIGIPTNILTFVLFIAIVDFIIDKKNLFKIKEKFKEGVPIPIISVGVAIIISLFFVILLYGPSFILEQIINVYNSLINPFGTTRWGLTVAESHQPYFIDWLSNFGRLYLISALIGSIILFYEMIKPIKEYKWHATILYIILISGIMLNRYSANLILHGTNFISKLFYFGSIALFIIVAIGFYLNSFYKKKHIFDEILKLDKKYTFMFVWFLFMLLGARSAIRLFFIFAPITAVLFSYLFMEIVDYINKIKYKVLKIISLAIILLVIFSPIAFLFPAVQGKPLLDGMFIQFARSVKNQAKYTGPIFDQQWQGAKEWVDKNTYENDVFVHWWDYGYLVQTGFERASVTDGGNAAGSWNHFVGRHVLLAENETEALEFTKAHEVSYLLIDPSDVGKYPAFASIGSDENYDRYSFIATYTLDRKNSEETRNGSVYLYRGGFPLDEDFVYNNNKFTAGATVIAGILLPIDTAGAIKQPIAVLWNNNQRTDIPLKCVFVNNQKIMFENGLEGCFRIIPNIDGQNMDPVGAGYYMSRRVMNTLFGKLYLFNEASESFKLAYTDEANMPLALYNGRQIGPLRIWKIDYPADFVLDEGKKREYLSFDFPNINVTKP